jgi:hypothetical protein
MFRRKADLPPQLWEVSEDARELAGVRRQGVPLAALYEFPADFVKSSSAAKPQQKAPLVPTLRNSLVLTLRNPLVPTLRVGMQRPDAPRPLRDPERRKHSFPRRAWERGYEDNRACDLSKVTNARRPHQGACCPPEVRL